MVVVSVESRARGTLCVKEMRIGCHFVQLRYHFITVPFFFNFFLLDFWLYFPSN